VFFFFVVFSFFFIFAYSYLFFFFFVSLFFFFFFYFCDSCECPWAGLGSLSTKSLPLRAPIFSPPRSCLALCPGRALLQDLHAGHSSLVRFLSQLPTVINFSFRGECPAGIRFFFGGPRTSFFEITFFPVLLAFPQKNTSHGYAGVFFLCEDSLIYGLFFRSSEVW